MITEMRISEVEIISMLIPALARAPNSLAETPEERGEYLVRGIAGCGNCHTPLGPDGPVPGQELAGRLVEKKGFHILIEALRLMSEAGRTPPCRIIGSGEEQGHLAAQIRDAGLETTVRLEGPRPQAEVIAAMRGRAGGQCLAMPAGASAVCGARWTTEVASRHEL